MILEKVKSDVLDGIIARMSVRLLVVFPFDGIERMYYNIHRQVGTS